MACRLDLQGGQLSWAQSRETHKAQEEHGQAATAVLTQPATPFH